MICLIQHIFMTSVLVLIVLIGMVALLMGVNRMFHQSIDNPEKGTADNLRHDIEDEESVIPPQSVFHPFLSRGASRIDRFRHYKSQNQK